MSILSRYLDAETLNRLSGRAFEPEGLVLGNLAGGHRSPLAGFAVEFAGHREYVTGDDPRHIDWRLFYTRDKLFIKQYEMETNLVCHLVLDTSGSMNYGAENTNKFLFGARLATTLAYSILKQNDKVAFATLDTRPRHVLPPGHSMAQLYRMVDVLESITPEGLTELHAGLMELAGRTGRRGIVMIFSDFLADPSDLEPALQQLRFRNHEVVLFQLLHGDELEFPLTGSTQFEGLESALVERMQAEDIRAAYLEALRKQMRQLDEMCHRNHVEFVTVNTSHPAAESLGNYLDERRRFTRR